MGCRLSREYTPQQEEEETRDSIIIPECKNTTQIPIIPGIIYDNKNNTDSSDSEINCEKHFTQDHLEIEKTITDENPYELKMETLNTVFQSVQLTASQILILSSFIKFFDNDFIELFQKSIDNINVSSGNFMISIYSDNSILIGQYGEETKTYYFSADEHYLALDKLAELTKK